MHALTVRRLVAALVASSVALGLAGAAAWSQRRELFHWWTLRELARIGIAPARVEVVRVDTRRFELRALRAGTGDELAIDEIDADYTLREIWQGRVGALRVSGVRLTGEIGADGPRFGGLESLAGGAAAGSPETPAPTTLRLPTLPTTELRIDAAHAEIATARGPLRVDLSVDAQDRDGQLHARADLVAHHALASAVGVLELSGAGDAITGAAALGVDLAPGAGLQLPLSAGSLGLNAQIEIAGKEILATFAPGPFALTWGDGPDALRLEGTTPSTRVRTRRDDRGALAPFEIDASGGLLRAPALDVAASGFSVDATLDPPWRLEGSVAVHEIEDTRKPRRAPGFALEGTFAPRESDLDFDLRAREAQKRMALRARGSLDPDARSAEAQLRLEPLHFTPDGLQPAQLAPGLAGMLSSVVGTIEATGRARYSDGRTQLTLDLAGRDLGFETRHVQVEGLNGALRFDGPSPFSTPPGQLVSIARIGFGLDLTDGLVAAALRPDGVVMIEKAEWQTLGGRVHTAGAIDPNAPEQALVLEAENLDLAQLLALVDLEGLSGEGRLDGTLPIERSGEAIDIDHGVFRARPGGRIRYQPGASADGLRHGGGGFEVVLEAFEDLAIEKLELELDGDANGPILLSLRLIGVNPEYQDGRPVHFNLNVESRLADILRRSSAAAGIPREIEERLQRFGQPER